MIPHTLARPRVVATLSRALVVATAFLTFAGCAPDVGPPPDETAKNKPPEPPKAPNRTSKLGGGMKVKSIKEH